MMATTSKHYANLLYRRKFHEVGNTEDSPEFIIRIYPEEFLEWKKRMLFLCILSYCSFA